MRVYIITGVLYILVSVVSSSSVFGQKFPRPNYTPTTNGCGSADFDVFDFFPTACNNHDICWGTCDKDEAACNLAFLQDMLSSCILVPYPLKITCSELAVIYYLGVSNPIAHEAYVQGQKEGCIDCSEVVSLGKMSPIPYCPDQSPSFKVTPFISSNIKNYDLLWSTGEKGSSITVRPFSQSQVSVTLVSKDLIIDGVPGGQTIACAAVTEVSFIPLDNCDDPEEEWEVPIVRSSDPNDIIGPQGHDPGKMIAKSAAHPYMIRFENDPNFATAPARIVKIHHPLDQDVNPFSLRLGSFGFGNFTFEVPPNRTFYSTRVNVADSLGVVVDITAGIDATKREAFWIFESKDPISGLAPIDASLGFLLVNDSSQRGEGFVTYTVKAANHTQTGDSIHAIASIVFDDNAPIETPIVFNTIDAIAPSSKVNLITPNVYSNSATISWKGQDDHGGSGVRDYTLYVSSDGGPFVSFKSGIKDTSLVFTGTPGLVFGFFVIARDNVGNEEVMKQVGEASVSFSTAIHCPAGVVKASDAGGCTAIVTDISPKIVGDLPYTFTLAGATTGNGVGSASGKSFNKGITTVTYFLSENGGQCSFTVTVTGRLEVCGNNVDDDCNGLVDEECNGSKVYYKDADEDGYGNPENSVTAETPPLGYVLNNTDCNDGDNTIHPNAEELCDNIDNNCNGEIDEGLTPVAYYQDNDGDGFGNPAVSIQACTKPAGYVTNNTDCIDSDMTIHPGAAELCDGKDNDCDNQIDEGLVITMYYKDGDGDGYGSPNDRKESCTPLDGYVTRSDDCDDSKAYINPAAIEICNGIDDNCNGQADEGAALVIYYKDNDGDGFGAANQSVTACSAPEGYVTSNTDCNDNDNKIYPGAIEVCDGKDNNCNGQVDEDVTRVYRDKDGDGYGDANQSIASCTPAAGYVTNKDDCNDNDKTIFPSAAELCDGKDNSCNGEVDEGLVVTYYRDQDGDGYGTNSNSIQDCKSKSGYVSRGGDCDDKNSKINPGVQEVCGNGIDDNCDGLIEENCGFPSVIVEDAVAYEADRAVKITVRLSQVSAKEVRLSYETVNGSAQSPKDFKASKGTITIPAGATSANFQVTIVSDNSIESEESFRIQYSAPVNATLPQSSAVVIVRDGSKNTQQLSVRAMPNPTSTSFTIVWSNGNKKTTTMYITDALGRLQDFRLGLPANGTINIGSNYRPGVYYIRLVQGDQSQSLKLIKQSK